MHAGNMLTTSTIAADLSLSPSWQHIIALSASSSAAVSHHFKHTHCPPPPFTQILANLGHLFLSPGSGAEPRFFLDCCSDALSPRFPRPFHHLTH